MTDNSEFWSNSECLDIARLGSCRPLSSRPVTRLQRFMQKLSDQFKRMKFATSSGQATQRYYRLESSESDSDIPLRSLSSVFGAKKQRSVGETCSNETLQVMDIVIQIPPGINNETIMYEITDTTSSSNNAEGASNIKFKNKSLAGILLSKEPALINLNFPKMDELIESFSENSSSDDSEDENTLNKDEQVAQEFADNSCSVKGEIRVFKCGRATLTIGRKVFVLAKAAKPKFLNKVVCVDIEDRMMSLGFIKHCIDVLPQEEVELGKNELQ